MCYFVLMSDEVCEGPSGFFFYLLLVEDFTDGRRISDDMMIYCVSHVEKSKQDDRSEVKLKTESQIFLFQSGEMIERLLF